MWTYVLSRRVHRLGPKRLAAWLTGTILEVTTLEYNSWWKLWTHSLCLPHKRRCYPGCLLCIRNRKRYTRRRLQTDGTSLLDNLCLIRKGRSQLPPMFGTLIPHINRATTALWFGRSQLYHVQFSLLQLLSLGLNTTRGLSPEALQMLRMCG